MHYSVLLVDDDKRVRSGLIKNIDWNRLNFDIPFQADSVSSALSVFSLNKIDVLITDIRMPGSSGLDLCRKVSNLYPRTTIVVLSGYSDFEYAQQAIQYGVRYYINKPTDLVEFKKMLVAIHGRLDAEHQAQAHVKKLEERYTQTISMLIEQFCVDISYGTVHNDGSLKNLLAENHIVFPHTFYCIAYVKPFVDVSENKYDNPQFIEILKNFIDMHFKNAGITFFTYQMNDHSINILLNYADQEKLNQSLHHLYDNCYNMLKADILIAVSGAVTNLEGLASCYSQVRQMSSSADRTGVLKYAPNHSNSLAESILLNTAYAKETEGQLLSYISSGDETKACNLVDTLFPVNPKGTQLDYCREFYLRMLFAIEHHIGFFNLQLHHLLENDFLMLKKAQGIRDVQEISKELKHCIHLVIEALKTSQSSFPHKLAERVREYIDTNYAKSISLHSASEAVHLSSSYISKIFKKCMGYNFVDYLTDIRIKKAKELLEDIDIKVYEVAALVGYKSTKHFSQVFKANVGMTPLSYKKSIQ